MRISDWSSDVCASALGFLAPQGFLAAQGFLAPHGAFAAQGLAAAQGFCAAQGLAAAAQGFFFTAQGLHGLAAAAQGLMAAPGLTRSEEHTSELQSLMRIT